MKFTSKKIFPFLMWMIPLSFFCYQFILRLWPGLMMDSITKQFSMDASSFGIMAAFYYYGYSIMQIPVAILLDRFGAKAIIFIFASLCGVATLIFSYTDNFYIAVASRFLIGVGSAVGFLGVSKVVSQWFPKENYAKMIGFSFTFGLMGAIYGGKPVGKLVDSYGSNKIALILGLLSIFIGIISLFFMKNSPKSVNKIDVKNDEGVFLSISNLKELLKSPVIWFLAISNLLMVGALEGFADVWGVSYFVLSYGIAKNDAAALLSYIFFGMLFGGPILAFFAKKIKNYNIIFICGIGIALIFFTIISNKFSNQILFAILFFLTGIMCCYQVIVFAAGSELVSAKNLGICIAFLNSINMLGGSFFHTCIGKTLDLVWSGTLNSDGLKVYEVSDYQYALSIIPICSLIGGVIALIIGFKAKK
jgi:MFS family permease